MYLTLLILLSIISIGYAFYQSEQFSRALRKDLLGLKFILLWPLGIAFSNYVYKHAYLNQSHILGDYFSILFGIFLTTTLGVFIHRAQLKYRALQKDQHILFYGSTRNAMSEAGSEILNKYTKG